jgi:large subunit ribosomal protein L17
MRHRFGYRKLNKDTAQRAALLRGLATQLISHGSLETTLERAKELRRVVEPLITLSKQDSLSNRRAAAAQLYGKECVKALFESVGPANVKRPGGYTRILRLGLRPGDGAKRALVELVDRGSSATKADGSADGSGANP